MAGGKYLVKVSETRLRVYEIDAPDDFDPNDYLAIDALLVGLTPAASVTCERAIHRPQRIDDEVNQ